MPQLGVDRPFDEGDLHHDRRAQPVRAHARQPLGLREWRACDFRPVEHRAELGEQLRVESRSDLAREHEVVALVVADEQCAEAHAGALRVGEAADDEVVYRFAFHLEPVLRPAMLVERVTAFRDHPFPALTARALPWLGVTDLADADERCGERQGVEQRTALGQR